MCVLPDGPEYDVLLRGMATSEKEAPSKQERYDNYNSHIIPKIP
jgi:hypothetical protein